MNSVKQIKNLISRDLHKYKHKQNYMQMQKKSRIFTYTYKDHLAPEKSTPPSPTQKYTQTGQSNNEHKRFRTKNQIMIKSGSIRLGSSTKPGLIYNPLKNTRNSTKKGNKFHRSKNNN